MNPNLELSKLFNVERELNKDCIKCSSCGHLLTGWDKYCSQCGTIKYKPADPTKCDLWISCPKDKKSLVIEALNGFNCEVLDMSVEEL
jgi:hypothetical protein